jgi:hypothetical protein
MMNFKLKNVFSSQAYFSPVIINLKNNVINNDMIIWFDY